MGLSGCYLRIHPWDSASWISWKWGSLVIHSRPSIKKMSCILWPKHCILQCKSSIFHEIMSFYNDAIRGLERNIHGSLKFMSCPLQPQNFSRMAIQFDISLLPALHIIIRSSAQKQMGNSWSNFVDFNGCSIAILLSTIQQSQQCLHHNHGQGLTHDSS